MACGTEFATRYVAFSLRISFVTNIRSKVVGLLKERNIRVTSVEFVRLTWLNKKEDQAIDDDGEDTDDDHEVADFGTISTEKATIPTPRYGLASCERLLQEPVRMNHPRAFAPFLTLSQYRTSTSLTERRSTRPHPVITQPFQAR